MSRTTSPSLWHLHSPLSLEFPTSTVMCLFVLFHWSFLAFSTCESQVDDSERQCGLLDWMKDFESDDLSSSLDLVTSFCLSMNPCKVLYLHLETIFFFYQGKIVIISTLLFSATAHLCCKVVVIINYWE